MCRQYIVPEWVWAFPSLAERRGFWVDHKYARNAEQFKWLLGVAVDIRRPRPEA